MNSTTAFQTILVGLVNYCKAISEATGRTVFNKTITMEDLNTLHVSEARENWILDYLEKAGFPDSKFDNAAGGFVITIDTTRFPDFPPVCPDDHVLVHVDVLKTASSIISDSAQVIKMSDYKINGAAATIFSLNGQAKVLHDLTRQKDAF